MKKIISVLICVSLMLSLYGCNRLDYKKAMALFQEEEYISSMEIFNSLGDYKDSKKMIIDCTYYMALNIYNDGNFFEAKEMFEQLGDYEDSQQMSLSCTYHIALSAYDNGNFAEAKEMFEQLGDYEDSQQMSLSCTYHIALSAYNNGNFSEAKEMFEQLGDYENSQQMSLKCSYDLAVELTENGDYENALTIFESLGDFEDSTEYAVRAKWGMLYNYLEENGTDIDGLDINNMVTLHVTDNGTSKLVISTYANDPNTIGIQVYFDSYNNSTKYILDVLLKRGSDNATFEYLVINSTISNAVVSDRGRGKLELSTGIFEMDSCEIEVKISGITQETYTYKEDSLYFDFFKTMWPPAMKIYSIEFSKMGLPFTIEDLGIALTE